ncbi:hypothetical protein [Streptomyces sp. NBC_01356]|uniref:hypothetical protein n=1 Tax=Streptomyces sp. NBC_01356 TaxID=2903836 RepID=UPI003FCE9583
MTGPTRLAPTAPFRGAEALGAPSLNRQIRRVIAGAGGAVDGRHGTVATRHDKLAVRHEAAVQIAAIDDWL